MVTTESLVETLGGRKTLKREITNLTELHETVRAGLPYASLEAVITKLGLAAKETSVAISLPQRTIARRKKERRLHADESDRLLRLARLGVRAVDVLGSEEKAATWLRRPNRALGGRIPLEVLDTDIGVRQVEAVLGRIEFGMIS